MVELTESQKKHREYIDSDVWKARRMLYFETHSKKCSLCSSACEIDLHHINYSHLGKERDKDLLAICRTHHNMIHSYQKQHKCSVKEATLSVIEIFVSGQKAKTIDRGLVYPKKTKSKKKSYAEKKAKTDLKRELRRSKNKDKREANLKKVLEPLGGKTFVSKSKRDEATKVAQQGDIPQSHDALESMGIHRRLGGLPIKVMPKSGLSESQIRRKRL